jgi:Holliday junction resolvasome RuvABC endonuclease subunit
MNIGIDYSMSCPAVCAYSETPQFWMAHSRDYPPLPALTTVVISSTEMMIRAEFLAQSVIAWLAQWPDIRTVALEDYAFSATGRVFHIGEHTGILKYLLYQQNYTITTVAPTAVKKFATGKGNADKKRMTRAFLEQYPLAKAWCPVFYPRTVKTASFAKSPLSDIADAYWIAKHAAPNGA